jgi:hypothetical protein
VIRGGTSHVIRSTFDSVALHRREHVIMEKLTVTGSVDEEPEWPSGGRVYTYQQ